MLPSRPVDKRLPARPQAPERPESPEDMTAYDDPDDPIIIETATVVVREEAQGSLQPPIGLAPSPIPSDSGRSAAYATLSPSPSHNNGPSSPLQSSFSIRRPFAGNTLSIPRGDVVPAPLSPNRAPSPFKPPSPDPIVRQDFSLPPERLTATTYKPAHARNPSHESVSWLDPIDESGGSACSSVHSRTSSLGIRRKHIRGSSGDTEAEFDAALDAAVEAAYDDGYEPVESDSYNDADPEDIVANAMRRVELAKERVRQTEREAGIESDRDWDKQPYMSFERDSMTFGELYNGSESEEEERMLDEMTREYAVGDFSFSSRDAQQSRVTRESNSSGVTSRTWNTSSVGSNAPTSTSVLSTVNESPQSNAPMSPPSLPPLGALPQIPSPQSKSGSSVRARRLSGQAAKQLKIETAKMGSPPRMPPPDMPASAIQAKTGGYIAQQRQNLSSSAGAKAANFSLRTPSSPVRATSPAEAMAPPPTPPPPPPNFPPHDYEERADSPASLGPNLRTNFSSSSLKSLRQRQMSVSGFEESDLSPNTPLSTSMTNNPLTRQISIPAVPPTPMGMGFNGKERGGFGGMQLFESDFHLASPTSLHPQRSSKEQSDDVPLPLEPCPVDVMLRPFWLMRALYQTLAHPRGGYVTNKLFVPRDAWKVKGVKLRNIEDKSSQCDLLTAALSKLALVDSNDADAVLEEMQCLEGVLETVQQNLIKKLGNEVGTQGVTSLGGEKDGEAAPPVPRSTSVSAKGGAFSWRRLRSKNSAANLTSAYGAKSSSGGSSSSVPEHKEVTSASIAGTTLPSLPMVSQPMNRPAKRDVLSIKFDGPFAGYMASLARLFDAAQTVGEFFCLESLLSVFVRCANGADSSFRYDCPPSRRPRLAPRRQDAGWVGTVYAPCRRVFQLLHLPVCACRSGDAA